MARRDNPFPWPMPCHLPLGGPPTAAMSGSLAERWQGIAWQQLQPSVPARQEEEDRSLHGQALVASASLWVGTEGKAHGPQQHFSELGLCFSFFLLQPHMSQKFIIWLPDNISQMFSHQTHHVHVPISGFEQVVSKAGTPGHLTLFWKGSKDVQWELGEIRPKKAGSRPIWPSMSLGSGV